MKVRYEERFEQHQQILKFHFETSARSGGLSLDSEGWADIEDLVAKANERGKPLSRALVEEVVKTNEKKRFTISEDGLMIRAAQGHSSRQVQIQHTECLPPEFLYHGTASRFVDSIKESGLKPGSRHYVHLSADERVAVEVGRRYGRPIVLTIKTLVMFQQGFKFYLADNGVWLTREVPAMFIDFN